MTDLAPATDSDALPCAAVLEHLTGPSRGRMTWLNESAVDVCVRPSEAVRIVESRAGKENADLFARLHRAGGSYEIEALDGRPVWVNGRQVTQQVLTDGDMVEFGESGPLSRFRLCGDDRPRRPGLGEILSDAGAYLRTSRQPRVRRALRAVGQVTGRLSRQTTILFRVGVVLALGAFAALAWQQHRINLLLQQDIAKGASKLESFAGALSRARREALTPADLTALREDLAGRLTSNAERLAALEQRSAAIGRVIAQSAPAVVFLQGAYGFRDAGSGRLLRHAVGEDGKPIVSPLGQPMLTLDGDGPVAERQFVGTGFTIHVGDAGSALLVTNRHVAQPWEADAATEAIAEQGLEPVMTRFLAWLPGKPKPVAVGVARASSLADLAILQCDHPASDLPALKLAEAAPAQGDDVIVMGYPTGLRSMLMQAGDAFIESLQKAEDTDFWTVAEKLAVGGHIHPLASRGIVGQITTETVVYDAETTHGGSGGPVLDMNGRVVAVNAAILPEYGGSNLGVPVAKVRALLAEAGLM